MRFLLNGILALILGVAGYQLYLLFFQKQELVAEMRRLSRQTEPIKGENQRLTSDLDYFKREENLAKELKTRFNYTKQGEKLIIIVPEND